MKDDIFSETFPVEAPRPSVRTHIDRPSRPKREPLPTDGGLDADTAGLLFRIATRRPELASPKRDSRKWATFCKGVKALCSGTFDRAFTWDAEFISNTKEKGCAPADVQFWAEDSEASVRLFCDSLDYALETPGYPWPPRWSKSKPSIADFLATYCPETRAWRSPFCLAAYDLTEAGERHEKLSERYPAAMRILDSIVGGSGYLSAMSASDMAQFWRGAERLLTRYSECRNMLMSQNGNNPRVCDTASLMTLVKEWYASRNGYGLGKYFLYPGNSAWSVFERWCSESRGLNMGAMNIGGAA